MEFAYTFNVQGAESAATAKTGTVSSTTDRRRLVNRNIVFGPRFVSKRRLAVLKYPKDTALTPDQMQEFFADNY